MRECLPVHSNPANNPEPASSTLSPMRECVPTTNNPEPASSTLSPIEILEGTLPPAIEDPNVVSLFNPCGVAMCPTGERVYIADTGHHRICVLERGGLRVLAGSGARGFADGAATQAAFAHPCGIALDSLGMLYVADCGNHRIRAVTPEGVVSTVSGNGTAAHRDGPAQYAAFFNPCGVAIDVDDFLYVTDYSNNRVRVLSRGGVVSTLATCSALGMDNEKLNSPYGIAVHSVRGSTPLVYVSSFHSNSLTRIDPNSGVTALIAGCGTARHADGQGEAAAFSAPNGLSVDADGNVYVADSGNHTIRRVSPEGEAVTLAGSGEPGLSPHHFNSPCGLCLCMLPGVGAALLVADRCNSCLRLLPVEALPPQACDLPSTSALPHHLPPPTHLAHLPRSPPQAVQPSSLRRDLRRLLEEQPAELEGEAVFEVQGRRLRASKALLSVRCEHFRALFTSGMRECVEGLVRLPADVDHTAFRHLIGYLLTDEGPDGTWHDSTVLELMMLANTYSVRRLEQLCARVLAEQLCHANAHEVWHCANLIGASHLARAASKLAPSAAAAC